MKKVNLIIGLGILLMNFVSAYGSYYGFDIRSLLNSVDPQTMLLVVLFIIIFVFLNNFVLSKFFKDKYGNPNKTTTGIIAFCISLLAIYGLNRTNFDISNLFYSIGISTEILGILIPIILIIGFFWFSYSKKEKKFKFYKSFLVLGGLILIVTIFTELIYEKGVAIILGAGLLLIGLWLWKRNKKRGNLNPDYPGRNTRQQTPSQNTSQDYTSNYQNLREKQRYEYYKKQEEQTRQIQERKEKHTIILQKQYTQLMKENAKLRKRNPNNPKIKSNTEILRKINLGARKKGIQLG